MTKRQQKKGKDVFKTWLQQQKGSLQGRGLFCWPIVLLATVTGGSCRNYHFCHNKTFVVTNTFLSQQNFCHGDNFYIGQKYVCYNKHMFVVTKHVICSDKSMLVATNMFVATTFVMTRIFCCNKTFDAASLLLSCQTHVCRNKHMFVMTKLLS